MRYLKTLYELKLFHKSDVVKITKNDNTAKEILRKYKKDDLITQIRRDYYGINDLSSKTLQANKYEIGCNINDYCYLSHHSALEFYGYINQVFNEITVASNIYFRDFVLDGITYRCKHTNTKHYFGVNRQKYNSLIKVTDREKTVLDCIDNISLAGGLDELTVCLALITMVDEKKMLKYLRKINKPNLYQKTGYMLSFFKDEMQLSNSFFDFCKKYKGNSDMYISKNKNNFVYNKEWKIIAPKNLLMYLEQSNNAIPLV
jgi:predicted transcriptional regulator of viral defense system